MTEELLHTYQVGWRLHGKTQLEKATVKLSHFGKLLTLLREKHGASTRTCAELIIHEIMPDGKVAVRMEHEEGKPAANTKPSIPPFIPNVYWGKGFGTEETLKEIGDALTPPIPKRAVKKNRQPLTQDT